MPYLSHRATIHILLVLFANKSSNLGFLIAYFSSLKCPQIHIFNNILSNIRQTILKYKRQCLMDSKWTTRGPALCMMCV